MLALVLQSGFGLLFCSYSKSAGSPNWEPWGQVEQTGHPSCPANSVKALNGIQGTETNQDSHQFDLICTHWHLRDGMLHPLHWLWDDSLTSRFLFVLLKCCSYVRAEVIAGFVNGLFLIFISFFIFSEAVEVIESSSIFVYYRATLC